jgi:type IV pilus assembly protein PilC
MSEFNYTAVDLQGKECHGYLDERSKTQVLRRVKEMGLFPMKVWEKAVVRRAAPVAREATAAVAPACRRPILGSGVRLREIAAFTRQLATLVEAGIPLMKGIKAIERQEENARIRRIQRELAASIEGGSMFSEALARHPQVFSKLYVNMAVAGETGGMLEQTLARLADLLERMERLKKKIITAMFYPTAVVTVAVGVMLVNTISGLMSLLEPVMIVFLAVIVGCIVFALFLPILSLMEGGLDGNRKLD